MGYLSDLHTYWAANLASIIPAAKFYTGYVPDGTAFPYAVVLPTGSEPVWQTDSPYHEVTRFQIIVFSNTDEAITKGQAIIAALDWAAISSDTIALIRNSHNLIVSQEENASGQYVYQFVIDYEWVRGKTY